MFWSVLLFLLWGATHAGALFSAARVWWTSEIYSHCFFVLPACCFIAWRERTRVQDVPLLPDWRVLPLLAAVEMVGLVGAAGGVAVLQHVAAFTALPLLYWMMFGSFFARQLWFPLLFVMACVPLGDQFIPQLQDVTATLAVGLLDLTPIPVFRSGLFIEIPNGRFHVAEACSGVSFLVASLAFGAFFAYVSYHRSTPRVAFFVLSAIVPILANGVRVFGLIVIGHVSDMELAVGVDHLIYGWVFFALILLILVSLGNRFADRNLIWESDGHGFSAPPISSSKLRPALGAASVVMVGILVWRLLAVPTPIAPGAALDETPLPPWWPDWRPVFHGADAVRYEKLEDFGQVVYLYRVDYEQSREGAELVSSNHRLSDEAYSRVAFEELVVPGGRARLVELVSSRGRHLLTLSWYQIGTRKFASPGVAKLHQARELLIEGRGRGAFVAIALDGELEDIEARTQLLHVVEGLN
ncbi:MAG: exosortase A [Pseudomonadales bacterium]|nr:exosortase A [Pseudomonadales bacterium]